MVVTMSSSTRQLFKQARKDGTPCRAPRRHGRGVGVGCFAHDPALAGEMRTEARREGGRRRSRPAAVLPADAEQLPLRSVTDVVKLLEDTINRVRRWVN